MKDKIIEVCSECLQASCYHGEFLCSDSRNAGTVLKPVSELTKLGLEHSGNWSDETLKSVYGEAAPNGYSNLISAAHDLLEALEHIRDLPEFKNLWSNTKHMVEKAIEKARGGT